MPIFEYECTDCGKRTEHLQLSSSAPLTACPECDGAVRKLMSAPAFQFKGSGWYVTDYAGKGKGGDSSGGNGVEKKEGAGGSASKKSGGSADSGASKASPAESSSSKAASPSD